MKSRVYQDCGRIWAYLNNDTDFIPSVSVLAELMDIGTATSKTYIKEWDTSSMSTTFVPRTNYPPETYELEIDIRSHL